MPKYALEGRMQPLNLFESILHSGMALIISLLEIMGAIIIVSSAARDFVWYFTGRSVNIRLDLARALALGLEFKLGGEILRTVIARDLTELLFIGVIIVLRGALSFLIHWEIGHIEEDEFCDAEV